MLQRQPGISIVGMGCSSFSNFFVDVDQIDDANDRDVHGQELVDMATLSPSHPRVQEWIQAVRYAIQHAGITVFDTAPWYGQGTSETVLGWALQSVIVDDVSDADRDNNEDTKAKEEGCVSATTKRIIRRCDLTINTKVGRYEVDPKHQFDFSREKTLSSIQVSLERLQLSYVDVLQLHDPEFALTLDQLMEEAIPALLHAQSKGWCRRLGMTGYPLHVQRQILETSMDVFQRNIWDQALVYCHYNLHDTTLFYAPGRSQDTSDDKDDVEVSSFGAYCHSNGIQVVTAAPLSMGLFTRTKGPPPWHPASDELKEACRHATDICSERGVDVSELATLFALSHPAAICTIIGMKDVADVQAAERAAERIAKVIESHPNEGVLASSHHVATIRNVLTESEWDAYVAFRDPVKGPFAQVWKSGTYEWDGVQCARDFWKHKVGIDQEPWHAAGL